MTPIKANIWGAQKQVYLGTWKEIRKKGFKPSERAFGALNDGTHALFFLHVNRHRQYWYATKETLPEIYLQEITPSNIASLRKYQSIVPSEDVYKKLCQYANALINSYDFDAEIFCKHWNGQEWLTFIGKDTQKRFFVYAGYYENYISVKPMYAPRVYRSNFPTIDKAIAYAESFEDNVIYCKNVRDYLPNYLKEAIDERHEWFNIKTGQLC